MPACPNGKLSDNAVQTDDRLSSFASQERYLNTNTRPIRLKLFHPSRKTDNILLPQFVTGSESVCGGFDRRLRVSLDRQWIVGRSIGKLAEAALSDRPKWLAPIYPPCALSVSPFLVDIEAAYEAGDLDRVMSYLNAREPALHVSIIETALDLEKFAQHLSRFIFILTPEEKQFTLRYADCAVLAPLSTVLNAAQWRTMMEPINRWEIHDRAGNLSQLPTAEFIAKESTPIRLNDEQLAALEEASEPDHCIAKVVMMRNGADLPGNSAERHAWAVASRRTWRAAGNSNPLILTFLTEAALLTKGAILQSREIHDLLVMDEASLFRKKLQEQTTRKNYEYPFIINEE